MSHSSSIKQGLNHLKHGAFAKTAILPGEDPAEFQMLCDDVFCELLPVGALEEATALTIAKHVWRKSRLFAFRRMKLLESKAPERDPLRDALEAWGKVADSRNSRSPHELRSNIDQQVAKERKEHRGEAAADGQIEQPAVDMETFERELNLETRLDMLIDRAVKRFAQLKAIKGMLGLTVQEHPCRPTIEAPKPTDAVDKTEPQPAATNA